MRMTDAEWLDCQILGGAAFIRAKIKAAKVGHNASDQGCERSEHPTGA